MYLRGVAQLVEQRTPNPQVAGSKPVSPAILLRPQPTKAEATFGYLLNFVAGLLDINY